MSQAEKVLLIADQDEQQRALAVVLQFLAEPFEATDSGGLSDILNDTNAADSPFRVAVVGDVGDLAEVIEQVYGFDQALPVLLSGSGQVQAIPEEFRSRVLATFDAVPNYNKFMDSLYRAQVFREQYTVNAIRGQQREVLLFRSLVGTSRSVQRVRELMAQVADKEVSVLITGESGTGKEVVARNLHYSSHRRKQPFVPVNCGAIPGELLESELFGHEKGAFTGAITARTGRFEMAKGGTLFLDEIGDMPLHMQVKILRVLQERTFEKVGSSKTIEADVRIIAATHKNLEEMIENGDFREDLYYRLNVFPIDMPPLRDRAEDIPLLLNELISRMEKEKRGSLRFNSAAILSLCRHDWQGNVRELANLVERLAIMYPYGVVGVQELPAKFRHVEDNEEDLADLGDAAPQQGEPGLAGLTTPAVLPVNGIDLKEYLANLEKDLIKQALDDASGVVARAAEKLHIRRTTLVEKVRKYGLNSEE